MGSGGRDTTDGKDVAPAPEAGGTEARTYPSQTQASPDSSAASSSDLSSEQVRESILLSVKQALGIVPDYRPFDDAIIMHINSVFSTLHQLGVGPAEPFYITGDEERWEDFINQEATQMARSYMYYKVRLLFDPPTANSSMYDSFDKLTKEYEWRLRVAGDEDRRLHGTVSASNREETSGDFDDLPGGGTEDVGW